MTIYTYSKAKGEIFLSRHENKINFSNNLTFLMFLFYRRVDFTHVNMLLLFYIINNKSYIFKGACKLLTVCFQINQTTF